MWIAPNGEQLTSSSSNDRITIVDMLQSAPYTSVLMFDPADDMDTGDYQCNVTVVPNSMETLILAGSNSVTTNLNVTGTKFCTCSCIPLFFPQCFLNSIIVTTNGSTEAGQTFSLICTVTMASDQTPRPNITWIKVTGGSTTFPSATQETTSTITTLTIPFSPSHSVTEDSICAVYSIYPLYIPLLAVKTTTSQSNVSHNEQLMHVIAPTTVL